MPVTPTYPGVYIQELASDVRTIIPVETATTAFVGRAARGPVETPVIIFSFEEFERRFGGLSNDSRLGFAVRDFFLNGGAKAVVVRVYRPGRDAAGATLPARARLPVPAKGAAARTSDDAEAQLREATGQQSAAQAALDAVQDKIKAEEKKAPTPATQATVAALKAIAERTAQSLAEAQQAVAEATGAAEAVRRGAELDGAAQEASAAAQEAQEAVAELQLADDEARLALQRAARKRAAIEAKGDGASAEEKAELAALAGPASDAGSIASLEAASVKATGELEAAQGELKQKLEALQAAEGARATNAGIELQAASEGSWGDQLVLRVAKEGDGEVLRQLAKQYSVPAEDIFSLTIRDTKTGEEEQFANVTLSEGPRRLDRVLAGASRLVQVSPGLLDGYAGAAPLAHGAPPPKLAWWESDQSCSRVTGPASADVLGASADRGEQSSDDQAVARAINALDHADIFNMLCIPPYGTDDTVPKEVIDQAAAYCARRRAILIVDPPAGWRAVEDAVSGFPTEVITPTANAAIFFPRLLKRNPLRDNQVEAFAPCGAVAGVIARTDLRRGVWKAPAGLEATLSGVVGLSVPVDDNQNGLLNPKGVNCLRVMPAAGPVVWGARTSEGDDRLASQWKYLPVRRMALWIEETLYRSTQWAVFEPNDEPLWSSLRLNIGNFMGGLFRQGAFQGRTPAEAFFVKCDAATTTQTDIDRGIVNVIVGFAPLKPAEFVIISIKQITNQGAA